MAKKTNLKSVRLSNEILEYINDFEGDGFNQKFENIIIFAMKTEIDRKKRLEELNNLIDDRTKELDEINKCLSVARSETSRYKQIMFNLKYL